MDDFTGPPAPESRLGALRAHRRALDEAPTPEQKPSIARMLIPLFAAQAADMLSTEKPFGFLAEPGTYEANPLPGMGSTMGRVGWSLGEALLAAALLKGKPSLGKAYVTGSNLAHNALVANNMAVKEEYRQRAQTPVMR